MDPMLSKISRRVYGIGLAIFLALLISSLPARAQFIGYTSPQTVNQSVFNNASCATSPTKSATMPNIGQSVHIVTYSLFVTGSTTPILRIMGSSDGVSFTQLSDDGMQGISAAGNFSIIPAYGAYPFIQIWVFSGGTGCTVTASYFGTSVSPPNATGAADVGTYNKAVINVLASSNASAQEILPPYGSTGGFIIFEYVGLNGPAGSTLNVQIRNPGSGDVSTLVTYTPTITASVLQFIAVPAVPASDLRINYTSGGASTGTASATYIFVKPGVSVSPNCEKSVVINTAAAGPTTIAGLSGFTQLRICSINLSSGTAEAIDLQQGTGTNCGTNNAQLTGLTHLAANVPWIQSFPGFGLIPVSGDSVCIHLSAANQTDGTITFSPN